jgi:hypothetical protein
MDIIIGLLGALVGGFIMSILHLAPEGGFIHATIVAVVGAVCSHGSIERSRAEPDLRVRGGVDRALLPASGPVVPGE